MLRFFFLVELEVAARICFLGELKGIFFRDVYCLLHWVLLWSSLLHCLKRLDWPGSFLCQPRAMKSSSESIGVDKWLYWLTDQENLSPLGISKMWKSGKFLLRPIFRDITWKNLLAFHHLAVDPLWMLTGEGHDFLRIVEVLLWCSVPNSAEEFSGIELRSSIHSLLVITVRSWAYALMLLRHVWNMIEVMMSIGITLSGS